MCESARHLRPRTAKGRNESTFGCCALAQAGSGGRARARRGERGPARGSGAAGRTRRRTFSRGSEPRLAPCRAATDGEHTADCCNGSPARARHGSNAVPAVEHVAGRLQEGARRHAAARPGKLRADRYSQIWSSKPAGRCRCWPSWRQKPRLGRKEGWVVMTFGPEGFGARPWPSASASACYS